FDLLPLVPADDATSAAGGASTMIGTQPVPSWNVVPPGQSVSTLALHSSSSKWLPSGHFTTMRTSVWMHLSPSISVPDGQITLPAVGSSFGHSAWVCGGAEQAAAAASVNAATATGMGWSFDDGIEGTICGLASGVTPGERPGRESARSLAPLGSRSL